MELIANVASAIEADVDRAVAAARAAFEGALSKVKPDQRSRTCLFHRIQSVCSRMLAGDPAKRSLLGAVLCRLGLAV